MDSFQMKVMYEHHAERLHIFNYIFNALFLLIMLFVHDYSKINFSYHHNKNWITLYYVKRNVHTLTATVTSLIIITVAVSACMLC